MSLPVLELSVVLMVGSWVGFDRRGIHGRSNAFPWIQADALGILAGIDRKLGGGNGPNSRRLW